MMQPLPTVSYISRNAIFFNRNLNGRMISLLPIVQQAFPTVTSYDTLSTVVQANAEGYRILCRPNPLVNVCNDDIPNGHRNDHHANDEDLDVFVKHVDASKYATTKSSWPDFRRTLLYLRTEVRFYNQLAPELKSRGFHGIPHVYFANYNLQGLVGEDELATDQSNTVPPDEWLKWGKEKGQQQALPGDDGAGTGTRGGSIVMESIRESHYFQDSPITLDQAKETLAAIAALHASAWEDGELLQKAEQWLSRGSYHLKTRHVKELAEMEQAWESFSSKFCHLNTPLFERTKDLGRRIKAMAECISTQVSPGPSDPYATITHGDFKSMNCFLPKSLDQASSSSSSSSDERTSGNRRGVILVDFASTGVGLGMSDVAMHIHHAVLPEHLANGGEEILINHYLDTLNALLSPSQKFYPREVAMSHYRLAVCDYFRFFLGRFWKSATPESFEKKKSSKNTALINRHLEAALAFLNRVDQYLLQIERNDLDVLSNESC